MLRRHPQAHQERVLFAQAPLAMMLQKRKEKINKNFKFFSC